MGNERALADDHEPRPTAAPRSHAPAKANEHTHADNRPGAPAGLGAASSPDALAPLLHRADAGTRERLAASLQQSHGNAAVQRLASGEPLLVQRWQVNLPTTTTDCGRVVDYMNNNSPYKDDSGWAKTRAQFGWGGDAAWSGDSGSLSATVRRPTVTKSLTVDMPRWAPTNPAMATAWSNMTRDLRAHEARHEGIANGWETTLRDNLTNLTVFPSERNQPAFNREVQNEWNGWIGQHQADQRAIDPYSALLDCSDGSEAESAPPQAPITGLDNMSDEVPGT